MTEMTRHRLRLRVDDPDQLTGFDGAAVLENTQAHVRRLRGDVELTHIAQESPDSIGFVLVAETAVRREDIDEIATGLREFLGIGPGPHVLVPDVFEGVRGILPDEAIRAIGAVGSTCPLCGLPDGNHLPGCPEN
jgi:hypothetical protein